jgi:speckle-type POZ protein
MVNHKLQIDVMLLIIRLHEPGVDNGWGWKKFCDNKSVQNAPHLEVKVKVWVTDPNYKVNQTLTSSSDARATASEALADDFKKFYENGELSDITIVLTGGVEKKVHGAVLAARSPVFLANLTSGMKEAKERRIDLSDVEEETANHFINFLYDARLDANLAQPMCLELLAIGKRYDVPSLVEDVGHRLIDKLDVENCARLLSVADRYGCERLRLAALKFATRDNSTMFALRQTEGYHELDMDCSTQTKF